MNRKIRYFSAVLALSLWFARPAFTMTIEPAEFVCPIDGRRFTQLTVMSGTSTGRMLDLRPIGAIVAPWPLPVCPDNRFVMYRRDFTNAEMAKLKVFSASPGYASLSKEVPYYRAAMLERHLRGSDELVAELLLGATWQARTPDEYTRYASDTLSAYRAVLASAGSDKSERPDRELVAGELERRLGYFWEAQARFERLLNTKELKQSLRAGIVRMQLRLIQDRDTAPHEAPDVPR